jgi:hypothetical protein
MERLRCFVICAVPAFSWRTWANSKARMALPVFLEFQVGDLSPQPFQAYQA